MIFPGKLYGGIYLHTGRMSEADLKILMDGELCAVYGFERAPRNTQYIYNVPTTVKAEINFASVWKFRA